MPIYVIRNSSNNSDHKIDTSLFVQKSYLRIIYIENNIEEDIDLRSQFRIKNSPDPISMREPTTKHYVNTIFKNDIDFKDIKLEKIKFVKVKYQPAVNEHMTPKVYVDDAQDEISLVGKNQGNDSNNHNLTIINSITLYTRAVNDNQVITKAYVDQFHQIMKDHDRI